MADCKSQEQIDAMKTACNNCVIPGSPVWDLFNRDGCELQLYESLVEEFTDIAGWKVKWWKSLANMDTLYGESANNDFAEPVETRLVYQPTEENSIIDAFGFKSDDVIQFALIPRTTFSRDCGTTFSTYEPSGNIIQPLIGDVITTMWNNRNYEIVDIGGEENIFQGEKPIWSLIMRPFRFSEQSKKAQEIYLPPNEDDITIIENEMEDEPGIDKKDYISDKFGDNTWVENESNDTDNYDDVDQSIFGLD